MFIVAALYHFTRFKDHRKLCDPLQNKCNSSGVTGSLLVAPEGINGTISGSRQGIDNVIEYIKTLPGCSNIEHKESVASLPPFPRMKVKIKKIVGVYILMNLMLQKLVLNGTVGLDLFQFQLQKKMIRHITGRSFLMVT